MNRRTGHFTWAQNGQILAITEHPEHGVPTTSFVFCPDDATVNFWRAQHSDIAFVFLPFMTFLVKFRVTL